MYPTLVVNVEALEPMTPCVFGGMVIGMILSALFLWNSLHLFLPLFRLLDVVAVKQNKIT
jgi:hypothetical protein